MNGCGSAALGQSGIFDCYLDNPAGEVCNVLLRLHTLNSWHKVEPMRSA